MVPAKASLIESAGRAMAASPFYNLFMFH
jgi:hypothetical protein